MKYLILLAALCAAGCATSKGWKWAKDGSTSNDYSMDMGQCKAQGLSGTMGMINMGTAMIINSCMEGKGWRQKANQ